LSATKIMKYYLKRPQPHSFQAYSIQPIFLPFYAVVSQFLAAFWTNHKKIRLYFQLEETHYDNITNILVILYGCENLFLTFRKENRLRLF